MSRSVARTRSGADGFHAGGVAVISVDQVPSVVSPLPLKRTSDGAEPVPLAAGDPPAAPDPVAGDGSVTRAGDSGAQAEIRKATAARRTGAARSARRVQVLLIAPRCRVRRPHGHVPKVPS